MVANSKKKGNPNASSSNSKPVVDQPKSSGKKEWEKRGAPGGRQDGTYIGTMSGAHIHFVSNEDHLKFGGERYDIAWTPQGDLNDKHNRFDPARIAEIDRMRAAWEHLNTLGNTSGVADVKLWLKSYLIDYHKVNASKVV